MVRRSSAYNPMNELIKLQKHREQIGKIEQTSIFVFRGHVPWLFLFFALRMPETYSLNSLAVGVPHDDFRQVLQNQTTNPWPGTVARLPELVLQYLPKDIMRNPYSQAV